MSGPRPFIVVWREALLDSQMPRRAKMLGLVMAVKYANPGGGLCWASTEHLARKASYSIRQSKDAIDDLVACGWLSETPRAGTTTMYQFEMPEHAVQLLHAVQSPHAGVQILHGGRAETAPELEHEQVLETVGEDGLRTFDETVARFAGTKTEDDRREALTAFVDDAAGFTEWAREVLRKPGVEYPWRYFLGGLRNSAHVRASTQSLIFDRATAWARDAAALLELDHALDLIDENFAGLTELERQHVIGMVRESHAAVQAENPGKADVVG